MTLAVKQLQLGRLLTSVYDFPEVGDELPLHDHDETNVHITIVQRGRFEIFGPGWIIEADAFNNSVLDWQPRQPHGFRALEKNSRIINIVK